MEEKRQCRESAAGCDIPEDLLFDILARMPAKSVARCRCLSKSYRDTIDSAIFTRKHYDLSVKTRPRVLVPLLFSKKKLMDIDCVAKVERLIGLVANGDACKNVFLGCSRGIICYGVHVPGKHYLHFHNPSTGASRTSCAKHEPCDDWRSDTPHALGYDAVTDDLKILKIVPCGVYFIYSSRTDSWKRARGLSKKIVRLMSSAEVFVDGSSCVHMVVLDELQNEEVLAFDFAAEEFKIVPLPPGCRKVSAAVANVDGCLCLNIKRSSGSCTDVWMMKEYGVEESWSRIFTIQSSDPANLVPLQLLDADQLVMLSLDCKHHPGLYLYDAHQTQPLKLMTINKHCGLRDLQHCLYTQTYKKP